MKQYAVSEVTVQTGPESYEVRPLILPLEDSTTVAEIRRWLVKGQGLYSVVKTDPDNPRWTHMCKILFEPEGSYE